MATEAFLELREIPGFKSRAFGFWKLVDDLARESNSFILGKERPHAPVDIYVWLEHLLGSDGMLGQALQASVACCSCFNYALEIASVYLGADPISWISFLLTCSTTCSNWGEAGLQYVHLLLGLLGRRSLGQEIRTYSQCMEGPATHGYKTDFLLMITITMEGMAPCGSLRDVRIVRNVVSCPLLHQSRTIGDCSGGP